MKRADMKPTRRIVQSSHGELVVEVTDRLCTMRVLRSRKGGPTEVTIPWGTCYVRALAGKIAGNKAARQKRKVRRSLLK